MHTLEKDKEGEAKRSRVEAPKSDKTDKVERSEKSAKVEKKEEKADKAEKKEEKAERKEDKAEKNEKASKERTSEKTTAAPPKERTNEKGASTAPKERSSEKSAAAVAPKERASEKAAATATTKERAPEKAAEKAAPRAAAAATPAKVAVVKGGLSEETMTQVAQAKYEAQEDKLRDVAKLSMALLRDYNKINSADCVKRVSDIRRCLMKYELQYIRVSEQQARRREVEIASLEAEAKRCHEEADTEADKIVELRAVLDRERRRRKRYEGYESFAAEVTAKKSRAESQAEIDATAQAIADLRQKRADLDAHIDERGRRAQLLRHAAAELATDLRCEADLAAVAPEAEAKEDAADNGKELTPSPSVDLIS